MRNRLFIIWTVVAAALAAALFAFAMPSAGRSGEAATEPDAETPDISPPEEPPDPSKLTYGVDPSLTPSMPEVEHLEGDDRPRPTARLRSTGGTESDLVLDELLVTFANDAELQAFVERWNGEVLQRDVDEDEGVVDALVRIDPTTAELDQLAVDLLAVEPHHKGELRASDERVFSLMAIAASESAHHGTEVAMNWVAEPFSIQDGVSSEAPDQEPNAFNWSWISSRQPQDSGIDAALQLLHGRGSVANRVKIMIVDHGFFYNADFPLEATMPTGEWRRENSQNCSNNSECPFHGTDVTMAAMGRPDNGFGTLGPAGTIGDLIALDGYDDMWGRFRDIKKVAKDERPGVINMSYGHIVTTFQDATERKADRWFRKIRDKYGALSFAAAGNDGIDVDSNDALAMPCEIDSVICVGGVQSSPLSRSPGSNFGTKTGSSTVEIYGPMCTVGLKNPDVPGDGATKRVCGTSVASPVVAGVAALVMAANPTLGPKDVWRILQDTAHRESLGPEVTGHNLRVDAHRAVSEAMNIPYTIPTVQIVSPANGTEFRQDEFFELSATAENFAGLDLPIQWRRANGGNVNDVPTLEPVIVGELEPGRHVFQAWAVDVLGVPGMATVEVVVENNPPQLSITSPAANTVRYSVEEVLLAGSTSDSDTLWQPLDDSQVVWSVRDLDTGTVVFDAGGHDGVIPANTLTPGDYEVMFRGVDDGGAIASDSSLLTILAVPPGESLPDVDIVSPDADAIFGVENGGQATINLRAVAHDDQDGSIGGERMRWIAEQGDTRIVLCEGSDFSNGGGAGDLASGHDCSDVDVLLGEPPGTPENYRWTLTVEVYDSANLPARASRIVTVQFKEG